MDLLRYAVVRRGLLTTGPVTAMVFVRSDAALPRIDVKLSTSPSTIDRTAFKFSPEPGMTVYADVSPPKSLGSIRLHDATAADAPLIDHRLLGDPDDVAVMIRAAKLMGRIYRAPALAGYVVGQTFPDRTIADDAEWTEVVRKNTAIGFHPSDRAGWTATPHRSLIRRCGCAASKGCGSSMPPSCR